MLENILNNSCYSASAERSFSKLKLIKNFLRTTMLQGRLVDLAMLSLESSISRSIDLTKLFEISLQKKQEKYLCFVNELFLE